MHPPPTPTHPSWGHVNVPLIAVAHGSRDARSAATVRRLVTELRAASPGLDVRAAFLDLSEPPLGEVLTELHAEGHRDVAVAPLLLGTAFHARVDLPQLIAEVTVQLPMLRVSVTDVLGPDQLLEAAVLDRLADAGAHPDAELGVVLAGVGSAHVPANDAVARVADRLRAGGGFGAVTHAFATCGPDVAAAIARLRAHGCHRFAVAPWFLAPGLLLDRVAALATVNEPDVIVAEPLGAHPLLAELVLARYAEAVTLSRAA